MLVAPSLFFGDKEFTAELAEARRENRDLEAKPDELRPFGSPRRRA